MTAPFRLVTGHLIDLSNPDFSGMAADTLVDAITTGLNNTCRFGGQLQHHYSVLSHSVAGAYLARDRGYSQRIEILFLLHDASEALGLGDVVSPLKALLPEYQRLEKLMMDAIYRRLGVTPPCEVEEDIIKKLDNDILQAEFKRFGVHISDPPLDAVACLRGRNACIPSAYQLKNLLTKVYPNWDQP